MKTKQKTDLFNLFRLAFDAARLNFYGIAKTVFVVSICIGSAWVAIRYVNKKAPALLTKQIFVPADKATKIKERREMFRQRRRQRAEMTKSVMIDPHLLFEARQKSERGRIHEIKEELGEQAVARNRYLHDKKAAKLWMSERALHKLEYHELTLQHPNPVAEAIAQAKRENQQIFSEGAYRDTPDADEKSVAHDVLNQNSGWDSFKKDFFGAIKEILRTFI